MISDKHKYIFLHIPKTGGLSVNVMLLESDVIARLVMVAPIGKNYNGQTGYVNKSCCELNRESIGANEWNKYFKFCFVRNPYDRIVSGWKYIFPDIPLKYFIKGLKTCRDGHSIWHCRMSQDIQLGSDVDYIGKMENFDNDVKKVFETLNLKYEKIKKLNITNHVNYREYYNEETRKLVFNMFRKDFERFEYEERL